jgi:cytochrome P450
VCCARVGCTPRLLILEDPPVHTALRRMVARGFTPSRIAVAEPLITDIAREHVADLVERGAEGELMRDLAMPFPVRVIAELLGIPPVMFGQFRAYRQGVLDHTRSGRRRHCDPGDQRLLRGGHRRPQGEPWR